MFIGYDRCFPEITRAFARQGATIASVSTARPMRAKIPRPTTMAIVMTWSGGRTRLPTRCGWCAPTRCSGRRRRVAPTTTAAPASSPPTGKIVDGNGHEQGLVTATVDLHGDLERARTLDFLGSNLLQDRRPELYGLLTR
jgi:hypothetical protein